MHRVVDSDEQLFVGQVELVGCLLRKLEKRYTFGYAAFFVTEF